MPKNKKQTQPAVVAFTDDAPVIEVVRAEELDPAAFAAAKNVTAEEINELVETAAAVDEFNDNNGNAPLIRDHEFYLKNHPECSGDPDTWMEDEEKKATEKEAQSNNAPAPAPADTNVVPATETVKPRVYHLRLSDEQLSLIACLSHSAKNSSYIELQDAVNIEDQSERAEFETEHKLELTALEELIALCTKSRTAPAGNGTTSNVKIFGKYSPVSILNWMGSRDFTVFDAKNAFTHFGIEDIEKTTFSRALAKGKDPSKNKVKIIDLEVEEELALFEFYNLAAREAARAATAKIDAVKARIAQLPTKQ